MRENVASLALAALVALPVLVLAVHMAGSGWVAVNADYAAILLRTWEVGSRSTPLVGAYSRFGWNHPGPLLFWVSSPAVRLLGPTGLLATAGLINAGAASGAVVAAHRIGGLAFAAPTAVAAAVMMHALSASGLIDPWNPYVAVVPFLAYLVCAWGAANGDRFLLIGAVLAGSWSVQAHLSYLPVTLAVAVAAVGWRLAHRLVWNRTTDDDTTELAPVFVVIATKTGASSEEEDRRPMPLVWVIGAVGLGLGLWLPPLINQFTESEGNLWSLYEFAKDGTNPSELPSKPVGWSSALDAAGGLFDAVPPWMHPASPDRYLMTPVGSVGMMVALLVGFAVIGVVAWRRGDRKASGLVALSIVLVPISVMAMARTADDLYGYLLRWTWAVAALGWIAAAWAILSMLGPRVRQVGAGLSCVAVVVFGSLTLTDDSLGRMEDDPGNEVVEDISDELLHELDSNTTYFLTTINSNWFYLVLPGIAVDLISHDQPVVLHEGLRNMLKDRWIADPAIGYPEVAIMPSELVTEWTAEHPTAQRLAVYDPRTIDAENDAFWGEPHEVWLVPIPS